MDKFVVDIDAVLDEFEQLESRDHPPDPIPIQTSSSLLWDQTTASIGSSLAAGISPELCNGADSSSSGSKPPQRSAAEVPADVFDAVSSEPAPPLSTSAVRGLLITSASTNCSLILPETPAATAIAETTAETATTTTATTTTHELPLIEAASPTATTTTIAAAVPTTTRTTEVSSEEVPVERNQSHEDYNTSHIYEPAALGIPALEIGPTTEQDDTEPGDQETLTVSANGKSDIEERTDPKPQGGEDTLVVVDSPMTPRSVTPQTQQDGVPATPQGQLVTATDSISTCGDIAPIQSVRGTPSPVLRKKQLAKNSTVGSSENSGSPAVKPKTPLHTRKAAGSGAVVSTTSPGVSSEQFEEFLRKKSLENAHLLSGHSSPVLQRYRNLSCRSSGDTASLDTVDFDRAKNVKDDRLSGERAFDNTKCTSSVHYCDNGTTAPSQSSPFVIETRASLEKEARRGLDAEHRLRGKQTGSNASTDSRSPAAVSVADETNPLNELAADDDDDVNLKTRGCSTTKSAESAQQQLQHSAQQRQASNDISLAAGASTGDRNEQLCPPGAHVQNSTPDQQLNQSPLKADACSNYYRIVSFDMSGVEVTDDDLTKLEEELRNERAPSRRSQDSNASIEPVDACQVITSEIAENVVNNNSSHGNGAGGGDIGGDIDGGRNNNNSNNNNGNTSSGNENDTSSSVADGSGVPEADVGRAPRAVDNPFIVPPAAVAMAAAEQGAAAATTTTTTGIIPDGDDIAARANHARGSDEWESTAEERRQGASAEGMAADNGADEQRQVSPHQQMESAGGETSVAMAVQGYSEPNAGAGGDAADVQRTPSADRSEQEASTQERNDLEDSEQGAIGGSAEAEWDREGSVMSPSEAQLGKVRPLWIQDEDAPICMNCGQDFTMFRRRHHCRACGKVLCSNCCKDRARLQFMEGELARVCGYCIEILNMVARWTSPSSRPDPSNPLEYCSTISPLAQVSSTAQLPPPTVMVPVGVLKKGGEKSTSSSAGVSGSVSAIGGSGSKSVVFSDGIRPGGDLTDLDIPSTPPAQRAPQRTLKQVTTPGRSKGSVARKFRSYAASDSLGSLPSVLLSKEFPSFEQPMTVGTLFNLLQDSSLPPVAFGLTRHNIQVMAKIVDMECCVGSRVWSFCSQGLAAFGQDEVVLVLEWHQDDELAVPRDVFKLYRVLFENAGRAAVVSAMDHLLFPGGLLGSSEHTGFLFVRRTLQCAGRLVTPNPLRESTYLVALLVLKTEVPWAKLFPLRLLLRLGAEFRYYPCPLVSVRFRKPVYFLEHQSILTILADFTNYQYTIQNIPGLVIHTIGKKTSILAPRNRYELMMKASTTNENILALGANFSPKADSHLVCTQGDDGSFQSQTFNSASAQINVRGASFVVFSGALKSNSGFTARGSVVEDGLLVQVSPIDMSRLKQAIHDMRDYRIICKQTPPSNYSSAKKVSTSNDGTSPPGEVGGSGAVTQDENEEYVELVWAANECTRNEGAVSVLDGASLAGVPSCKMFSGTDFSSDRFIVRWTEVFFLASKDTELDLPDPNRLIDATGRSMCIALLSHAAKLYEMDLTKLALRISLDPEQFGYEIGAGGSALAAEFLGEIDNALVPIITSLDGSHQPMTIELIFYVLLKCTTAQQRSSFPVHLEA